MEYSANIEKLKHSFLPESFELKDWQTLEPYFIELRERDLDSKSSLENWLKDLSELEAFI